MSINPVYAKGHARVGTAMYNLDRCVEWNLTPSPWVVVVLLLLLSTSRL